MNLGFPSVFFWVEVGGNLNGAQDKFVSTASQTRMKGGNGFRGGEALLLFSSFFKFAPLSSSLPTAAGISLKEERERIHL